MTHQKNLKAPKAFCLIGSITALLSSLAAPALAQDSYPSRPIRIVVPYAAGGATDFVARKVGDGLAKSMGQPVVVDNKSGAGGAIGAAEVARARADGYTLLMTITDSQVNNTALFKNLSYDPLKDFIPITQLVRSPTLLSTHPGSGIKSLADLKTKVNNGGLSLSYASWGIGGLGHLQGETLNRSLKAGMVHVAQRGEAPVISDLLAGTVELGYSSVGSAMQHVPTGKLIPLAVMGHQRSTSLPQVPSLRELGMADPIYDTSIWIGLLSPAKTPAPIVDRLAREVRAIVGAPEMSQLLNGRGFEVMNSTPEQFADDFKPEFEVVTRKIRELGIQPQ